MEITGDKMKNSHKLKKIKYLLLLVFIILISTFIVKQILIYSNKASISEILPRNTKEDISVIIEDSMMILDNYPRIIKDNIYLPVDLVSEHLNNNFFWDNDEKILTYTTKEEVIRMETDALTYFINDEPLELNMPIIEINTIPYMPLNVAVKLTNYKIIYNTKYNLLIIDDKFKQVTYGDVKQDSFIRLNKNDKSPYIKRVHKHDKLIIYDDKDEDWVKVRNKEGLLGYIKRKEITNIITTIDETESEITEEFNINKNIDGKINMVWHQVTNVNSNGNVKDLINNSYELDVISPTWFALKDTEGNISSLADIEYVNWAHKEGYQVWALFSNSFDASITHEVLSSTKKRQKVIKQILAYSAIYNLDGINIDFENIAVEDGKYFVQFIKELTPYLKKQGLIVSVDMYVPKPWTSHYNRKEIGKIIDYLIIMGYDEHWSGSSNSGSVASIGFVEKGIKDTLLEVPKEKILLGIPYYTRLWSEEIIDDKVTISSKAYSMNRALELIKNNNANIVWDNETGQYYSEYIVDDIIYKIWLEEEKSIEEKVKLVNRYQLEGISGWKLGLEKEEVWSVLKRYLK